MQLGPGIYHFSDLSCGDCLSTGWVRIDMALLNALSGIVGGAPDAPHVPPLALLARIEGAKASGPVQIMAEAVLSWQIEMPGPLPPGGRVRAHYTVMSLRKVGRGRAVVSLALRVEGRAGQTVMTGQTRLTMPSN